MKPVAAVLGAAGLKAYGPGTELLTVSVVAVILSLTASALAGGYDPGEGIIAFADFLYDSGDYLRAAIEYKRYIFLFPEGRDVERAIFRTGLSYRKSGKPKLAISEFKRLLRAFPGSGLSCVAKFEIGRTYFLSGDYGRAKEWFSSLSDPAISRDARCGLGWTLLEEGRWAEASDVLSAVSPELAGWARGGMNLPRRSPALSAILSTLVPGAGQIYCGRPGDGFYSFVLSGSFGLASYLSIRDGNTQRGYLLGAAAVGFYLGNVYGAALAAMDFNARKVRDYIRMIEERAKPLGLDLPGWRPRCTRGTAR